MAKSRCPEPSRIATQSVLPKTSRSLCPESAKCTIRSECSKASRHNITNGSSRQRDLLNNAARLVLPTETSEGKKRYTEGQEQPPQCPPIRLSNRMRHTHYRDPLATTIPSKPSRRCGRCSRKPKASAS